MHPLPPFLPPYRPVSTIKQGNTRFFGLSPRRTQHPDASKPHLDPAHAVRIGYKRRRDVFTTVSPLTSAPQGRLGYTMHKLRSAALGAIPSNHRGTLDQNSGNQARIVGGRTGAYFFTPWLVLNDCTHPRAPTHRHVEVQQIFSSRSPGEGGGRAGRGFHFSSTPLRVKPGFRRTPSVQGCSGAMYRRRAKPRRSIPTVRFDFPQQVFKAAGDFNHFCVAFAGFSQCPFRTVQSAALCCRAIEPSVVTHSEMETFRPNCSRINQRGGLDTLLKGLITSSNGWSKLEREKSRRVVNMRESISNRRGSGEDARAVRLSMPELDHDSLGNRSSLGAEIGRSNKSHPSPYCTIRVHWRRHKLVPIRTADGEHGVRVKISITVTAGEVLVVLRTYESLAARMFPELARDGAVGGADENGEPGDRKAAGEVSLDHPGMSAEPGSETRA
ncbi:hypothetical protein C8R47DRAFT_1079391 [Mycena vitilis]|nr:hypothetical protein C8R47DRAFT_1079391 [Mycena vitilis]